MPYAPRLIDQRQPWAHPTAEATVQRNAGDGAYGRSTADAINDSPRQVAQRQHISALRGVPGSPAQETVKEAGPVTAEADHGGGLPAGLRNGIESLSGVSMADVKVHYNSSAPAQLRAGAYAQGRDIHLASGQEGHLPHEAWHIVQQAQGRVRPTLQMKDGAAINDDAELEREADVMGRKALHSADTLAESSDLQVPNPQGEAPVQRKVGLEIEVPVAELHKGVLKPQQAAKEVKAKQEKPSTEHTRLISGSYLLLEEPGSSEEERKEQGGKEDAYTSVPGKLVKGESIYAGTGWNLTADIIGEQGIAEFITDPFDETKEPEKLAVAATAIGLYADQVFGSMSEDAWAQLPKKTVVHRRKGLVEGNIHVTGGVRPDRIIELLEQLSTAQDDPSAGGVQVDESSRRVLGNAVLHAKAASLDPNYQGLVAMLAAYVAGNWRVEDQLRELYENLDRYHDESGLLDSLECLKDADALVGFVRTGTIVTRKKLSFRLERYEENPTLLAKDLRIAIKAMIEPRAAKMMVPVLSRSSLGELRDKVQIANPGVFKNDVMTAAGMAGTDLGQRLFPLGLDTSGHQARTIEARPDITIGTWLQSVLNGENLSFTDETKSFENVGPGTPYWCCFESREKGAVLETRALDGEALVPSGMWGTFAKGIVTYYQHLNRDT